ncbi:biotin--[acetyl-CoA-carboxylase] ligase [Frateuria aurantia]
MTTASMILQALADGECQSGAALAVQAGVTRAAIWKQIEALRAAGLPIQTRGRQGYQLPWSIDLLDLASIQSLLPETGPGHPGPVSLYWDIDSTSSELQRRGMGIADLSWVLAETQTAGRGRRGRSWLSPPGLNLYMSCFKRFERGFSALTGLSLAVGVMVVRTLEQLQIQGAGLKWPNDVVCEQGKLGGILIELVGEYQGPCAAVIGIGLNLRVPEPIRRLAGQPVADLGDLAGGQAPARNRAAATLITQLSSGLRRFETEGLAAFADDYARLDRLRDTPLRIEAGQHSFEGLGAGIDAVGALQVITPNGIQRVDSAEVSVRRA